MALLDNKRRARVFYRFLSKVYDKVNPVFWNAEMRREAIEMTDIDDDSMVLDVGCGTGFGSIGLREKTEYVIGLDQSPHQLEKAEMKDELGDVDFVLGDAENLPFEDELFDLVWSSGSIEYWPRPLGVLEEIRRVTKPGGGVLIVGPRKPDNKLMEFLADSLMFFYTEEEANNMMMNSGWGSIENKSLSSNYLKNDAIATYAENPK